VLYAVFGVGTTVISFATYYLFRWIFPDAESVPVWLSWIFKITSGFGIESSTALPVILSWVFSVTFAFVTNRVYVFGSAANTAAKIAREALKFYASRLATLAVDLIIMFLLVDLTGIESSLYEFVCKVFSNCVVLVLNYVLSKVFVFRKKKPADEKRG
jgi:putative flippase GtrA